MLALGIVEAELIEPVQRHANAKNLSGTQMAVSDFGFAEKFVERLHGTSLVELGGE